MLKNMPLISRCVSRLNDSKRMKSSNNKPRRKRDDWLFFGLCSISNAELGYVALSDLQSIETIERDLYWSGTLADAKKTEGI